MLESVSVTATICVELDGLEEFDVWVRKICSQNDFQISVGDVIDDEAISYALTCTLRNLEIPGAAIRTHSVLEERTKCNL